VTADPFVSVTNQPRDASIGTRIAVVGRRFGRTPLTNVWSQGDVTAPDRHPITALEASWR
jgi:hypothetical protein